MMSPVGHNAATADVLKTLQTLGPAKEPFVDVKLGAVLGSGGYGRVFKGMWDGTRVAVKVIEAPKKRLFPEARGDERLAWPERDIIYLLAFFTFFWIF